MKFIVPVVLAACGSAATSPPDAVPDGAPDAAPDSAPDAAPLPTGAWTSPHRVVPIANGITCQGESLTQDLLTMYATCGPYGSDKDYDIAKLTRASVGAPWSAPVQVAELSSPDFERGGTVAPDELTIWFTRNIPSTGETDVFVSTRASKSDPWGTPTEVPELSFGNGAAFQPRVLASGLAMTEETFHPPYRIMSATRSSATATWERPEPLMGPFDLLDDDSMMSEDQLQIVFSRSTPGCTQDPCDTLYVATRAHVTDLFGTPAPITELAAIGDLRYPWMSADGHTLYFAVSTASGPSSPISPFEIWEATR